ncbi:MAG: rhomboid family intramembrane serine protease [Acidobacteriota bacterium]|nr:rhomboid family intramembrane serine protease [Acidobacteriota bacterium]
MAIWTVKMAETWWDASFTHFGMFPRDWKHLYGIVTMPFLHKDFGHLYANSFGVFVLTMALFQFYEKVAWRVILHSVLWGGVMVWIIARPAYHIGASGLIYSLTAFLFLSGILRRDRASVGVMLIVAFLYGGAIWGVFPIHPGISWEGHLCGAIVGCLLAVRYRRVDPPPRDESEDEDEVDVRIDPDEVDDVYQDSYARVDEDDDDHFRDQMYRRGYR